jgi:hypothetical protein
VFSKTAAEREESGDPRKSIAERYSGRDDYMKQYSVALDELVQQRWDLPEDRRRYRRAVRRSGMRQRNRLTLRVARCEMSLAVPSVFPLSYTH